MVIASLSSLSCSEELTLLSHSHGICLSPHRSHANSPPRDRRPARSSAQPAARHFALAMIRSVCLLRIVTFSPCSRTRGCTYGRDGWAKCSTVRLCADVYSREGDADSLISSMMSVLSVRHHPSSGREPRLPLFCLFLFSTSPTRHPPTPVQLLDSSYNAPTNCCKCHSNSLRANLSSFAYSTFTMR